MKTRVGNFDYRNEAEDYLCGVCGKPVHETCIASATYDENHGAHKGKILWCICPCGQPTVITMQIFPAPLLKNQHPLPMEFIAGKNWPPDLERLFREAAASFAAGAFTASAMVCRKILMVVACEAGAQEGQSFASYVDHIIAAVVPIPSAKPSIDKIRTIGNDANHDVAFVAEPEARRAMSIAAYVLNSAYSLPSA